MKPFLVSKGKLATDAAFRSAVQPTCWMGRRNTPSSSPLWPRVAAKSGGAPRASPTEEPFHAQILVGIRPVDPPLRRRATPSSCVLSASHGATGATTPAEPPDSPTRLIAVRSSRIVSSGSGGRDPDRGGWGQP